MAYVDVIRDKVGKYMSLGLTDLDVLIDWKIYRYAELRDAAMEGKPMQDQVTIECRFDFTDKGKVPEIQKLACAMARTLAANIQLLDPICKPELIVYMDDFMSPPQKVNMYEDLIGKGNAELQEAAGISSELLSAVTGENK